MCQDPTEQFAGNSAINAEIHEILASFPEPSRSMMRKKIRQDRAALDKHGTDQADESARHTFREFLVARQLNNAGFCFEYNKKINEQTPDWYDEPNQVVLEVFTCERGGRGATVDRVATRLAEKVTKYSAAINSQSLHFVVAVHGDFLTGYDEEDCKQSITDGRLFEGYPELSGVIFFAETNAVRVKQVDSSTRWKQLYGYWYFRNPDATRKIDLAARLSGEPPK